MKTTNIFKHKLVLAKGGEQAIIGSAIAFLLLLYSFLGAFPFVPIENDGMRISLGAQSHSIYGNYEYAYEADSQSGTYQLIEFLANNLNLDFFKSFSILTLFSSIVFLLSSSIFLKRMTSNHFIFAFLSIILFQETIVSGYYPNSSMVAAMFIAVALLLATRKDSILNVTISGIALAVAIWTRFDTVLVSLAFPILLLSRQSRHIKLFLLFCTVMVMSILLLFYFSSTSLLNIIQSYIEHAENSIDISRTLNNYSTIFTLAILLFFGVGIYRFYQDQKWRPLILSTLATLPLVVAYGLSVNSPKYLLYGSILWAIPICYCMNLFSDGPLTTNSRFILFLGILVFVGQYILTPPYEMVLGRSTIVFTADGARLRGAITYSPIYYAKYRRELLIKDNTFQDKLNQYLQEHESSYIISQDWMTNQWVLYFLQSRNYRIQATENYASLLEDGQRLILSNGRNTVYLVRWRPETDLQLPVALEQEIEKTYQVLYIGPDYTTTDYAQKSFLSKDFDWQIQPDWGRFETILFTHKPAGNIAN